MANTYKSEYEFYPSEDKHEGDCHVYRGGDHHGLSDANLSSIELRQHPYMREKYSVNIVFDTPGDKRAHRQETVQGLLAGNAGIENIETKSFGNASGFSVTINDVDQKDLMRIAVALTQAAPKDKSDFHYPVMGQAVAEQIIANELDRLKITPVEAGLVSIKTEEMTQERAAELGLGKPVSYVDVSFNNYPLSPVAFIREDGTFTERNGETAMQVTSKLTARDGQAKKVVEALQGAGIKATKSEYGNFISTNATADAVAEALQKSKLLSGTLTDTIKSVAEKAHPGQREINAEIEAQGAARIRAMSAGAATPT